MTPQTPVIWGIPETSMLREVIYAKDQPPYLQLPALVSAAPGGKVTTRWRLTLRERLKLMLTADLYVQTLTFHERLQPIKLTVDEPQSEDLL